MGDSTYRHPERDIQDAALQGAVIVAIQPGQPKNVLSTAARYAKLFAAPLVVVHVDVTRFVTYEGPDGFVHTAPIDLNLDVGAADFAQVLESAAKSLDGTGLTWTARQLVGDPALAIKKLAITLDAELIVVGTRRRGLGESIREFFTGSVAARLAHRQSRPVLVIPQQEDVPDEQESIWPDDED